MAVMKQSKQSRRSGNLLQFCIGVLVGACVMNLWSQQDRSYESSLLEAAKDASAEDKKEGTGWHPVNVFYGEKKGLFNDAPKRIKESQESFSQVGQDSIILDLLGSDGYFIDLAANDALDLTNTLALERKGWTGLCVEPNPVYWYGLSHRTCTVVGALVAGTKSEPVKVKFRGALGGIVGNLDDRLADKLKVPNAPELTRYTAPITEVLDKFGVPTTIDYLSLDVEGSEYEVMKDFPFDKYTIRVMTVERPNKDLQNLLKKNGYLYLAKLVRWGEYLWCHESTGFTPDHEKIKKIKPPRI